MLRGLTIRDILLIEQAEIAFAPGLNVLTGETGAGKSILLDALGFALGARGRGQLARPGAGRGEVTAVFELRPDHPARAILEEAGLPAEEELVLRRLIDPDGRSRAFVNDRRAGVETLARLAATLVEVHGQQDERGLTDPRGHRALLDAYAGDDPAAPVRAAWAGLAAARRRLERRREEAAAAARDADFLAHAVEELRRLDPQPGEEAELDARRRQMQAAQRIREDVARAAEALGPRGAEGQITDAARWLDGAAAQAGGALDAALAALDRCLEALGEASRASRRRWRRWPSTPPRWNRSRKGCSRSGRWRASTASCPGNCPPWPASWPRGWRRSRIWRPIWPRWRRRWRGPRRRGRRPPTR
ncbi:MAG: hypothetical protein KatS3mg118_0813 [Paracoccaceae bacterium]|nr:MAG: hypothetical protein KatS3mg118_0813 [Paracoccaceae bacterium]